MRCLLGKRWSGTLCLFDEILVHEVREVWVSGVQPAVSTGAPEEQCKGR